MNCTWHASDTASSYLWLQATFSLGGLEWLLVLALGLALFGSLRSGSAGAAPVDDQSVRGDCRRPVHTAIYLFAVRGCADNQRQRQESAGMNRLTVKEMVFYDRQSR